MSHRLIMQKYVQVMKEIKRRTEAIDLFLDGSLNAHYRPATIESTGLQFRKVFELIAFASLAANREEYSKQYADFSKHWEAARLVKNLKSINDLFFPQFSKWRAKFINLLNAHEVHLLNDPGNYVIHMKESGHDDVSWYRSEPVEQ